MNELGRSVYGVLVSDVIATVDMARAQACANLKTFVESVGVRIHGECMEFSVNLDGFASKPVVSKSQPRAKGLVRDLSATIRCLRGRSSQWLAVSEVERVLSEADEFLQLP